MRRPPRPHPCAGVPRREQQRLALLAHVALDELPDPQAVVDLLAAALVVDELLQCYTVDGAAEAVRTAQDALSALREGHGTADAARRACGPLLAAFESLLAGCTWRRLQDAQRAAARRLAAVPA